MRYLLPAVLGALSLIYADGAVAQDVPACVPECSNQVRGQFTQYSCVSADDAACLCGNANFGFGVRDCGQSGCGATDVQIQAYLAGSFCQGQALAFTPTGAPAPPTSGIPSSAGSPPATTPTGAVTTPSPTTAPATSSSIPETIPQTSSPATSPPTTSAPPTTTPATTGPATAQTSPPSTSTAPPSTSTDAVSSQTSPPSSTAATSTDPVTSATESSSPASSDTSAAVPQSSGSGLSQGAAIGIGVGVAGGVVAIAFAAVFLFLRNRSQGAHASFDISQPPSSGHGQGAFEKYSNDIEMVSNRYEDMVPRQQPKVMV
ncbi:extracellular membrane, cfem domain [Trichoderma arundinaceum]|uniref:Extracellular membrane, cfem domain n=1 Tax=Trichoderma arundinaceum TaxID=490622 RepID=A0A395NU62_TRIAR|nr:extracellular membrane, cfem domain [Trichoderma arundinaceum]